MYCFRGHACIIEIIELVLKLEKDFRHEPLGVHGWCESLRGSHRAFRGSPLTFQLSLTFTLTFYEFRDRIKFQ